MNKLIKCETCQKEIAKIAKLCPNCGQPTKAERTRKTVALVIALVLTLPWALLIGACVIGTIL